MLVAMTASEPPGFFMDPVPEDADEFDATGITYRINLLGHEIMKAAFPGLNVVDSPVGTVPVDDFCTGRIQGAELGTLASQEAFFFERFDHPNGANIVECGFGHLYLSSWQQLMLSSWLAVNRQFFESLDPHERKAIRTAAEANTIRSLLADFAAGGKTMKRVAAAGATIHASLPADVLARLRGATAQRLEEAAAADPDFAAIIASMREFAQSNEAALLYDGVARDERFNLFPGWASEDPIRRD